MYRIALALLLASIFRFSFADTIPNNLVAVAATQEQNFDVFRIEMDRPIKVEPVHFVLSTSPKIIIDLPDTKSRLSRTIELNQPNLISVTILYTDDRTRIILTLKQKTEYNLKLFGNELIVELDKPVAVAAEPTSITYTKTPYELIVEARKIVSEEKNLSDAIEPLNSLLLMAANEYTEEAQEMIGRVYERTDKPDRAKAEYKIFLATYPNSPLYTKIKERLIAIEIAESSSAVTLKATRKPRLGSDRNFEASISEYYIAGASGSTGNPTQQDQSTLISNVRITGLFKEDQHNTKIVARGSILNNYIKPSASKDQLGLAYVDYQDTYKDYGVRVGRQTTGFGTIGLFDGVTYNYGINDGHRFRLISGVPYIPQSTSSRNFYGFGVESIFNDRWSSSVYYNKQFADGILERSAIGSDIQYINNNLSLTSTIEYDTLYSALNTAMVQGNIRVDPYSYYFLYDKRKSPMLFGERAVLIGLNSPDKQPYNNVGDTFNRSGLLPEEIYSFINNSTATSTAYVLGVSRALNDKWTATADYQITNMSATTDTSFIQTIDNPFSLIEQPAANERRALSVQLFGTDIFRKGHNVNLLANRSLSVSDSQQTLTILNGFIINENRLDLLLMYIKNNQLFTVSDTTASSVRLNYRLDKSMLEIQLSATYTITTDILTQDALNSHNYTLVIGWKKDF